MNSSETGPAAPLDAIGLRELLDSGNRRQVLDVRTPAEFESVHIPGTHNIPLDLLRQYRVELRPHLDDDVILVCHSGARATQAQQTLIDTGLPAVKILDGGLVGWLAANAPVNRGRTHWDLERQVRLVAGLIVLVSVLASTLIPGLEWVAALVGAGLAVAALTNTCAMGMLLAKLPYNRSTSCGLDTLLDRLRDTKRSAEADRR